MTKSLSVVLATAVISALQLAYADDSAQEYDLKLQRQSLAEMLKEFSRQTGLNTGYIDKTGDSEGIIVGPLKGRYTADAALAALLYNTGLTFKCPNDISIVVTAPSSAKSDHQGPVAEPPMKGFKTLSLTERDAAGEAGGGFSVQRTAQTVEGESRASVQSDTSKHAASIDDLEGVVVTGTHIKGAPPIGSHVIVIDREEIRASGHGRVQDLLETLPLAFSGTASEDRNAESGAANGTRGQAADLRGLGVGTTLVLVNGRRQPAGGLEGSFVDISSIAASAVERIEVLPDGASAIYGADAVGGVINYVLRDDYEGFETSARIATADMHAEDVQVSMLGGASWSEGNVLIGAQYSHRDALMTADTHYGSMNGDYRPLGGSDFRELPSRIGGVPGTILNASGQPVFAIPAGQDGRRLTVADLIPGRNYVDAVTGIVHLSEQTQPSGFFTASHRLNERFELFAEGRYGRRRIEAPSADPTALLLVPSTNPFYVNPFGGTAPVRVRYSFGKEIGLTTVNGTTDTYTAAVGAIAKLPQQWELNVVAEYGREKNDLKVTNLVSSAFAQALAAALADRNSTTALNVFGNGSANNPATLASIDSGTWATGDSSVSSFTAISSGPLFRLPSGAVRLALGVDYRDEGLDSEDGQLVPTTGAITRRPASVGELNREVVAAFAELRLPLLGGEGQAPSPQVELSAAARYEEYSDFGSTFNPKIGINVSPLTSVLLRGTWGTSFRPPRFNQLSPTRNVGTSNAVLAMPDPRSPTGFSNALSIAGGNPDLREETAEVWTAGVEFDPDWAGVSISATYFHLNYKDKIRAGGETSARNTLLFEDRWAEIITRNPTVAEISAVCNRADFNPASGCPADAAAILDLRLRNFARMHVRGVDLDIGYRRDLAHGSVRVGLLGTRLLTHSFGTSTTSPMTDVLDTVDHPVSLRLRGTAGWSAGGWSVHAAVNYLDDYRDPVAQREVDSWTTVDLGGSYTFSQSGWLNETRIQVNTINVLDQEPPFVNDISGYDPANASQAGRSFILSMSKQW